MRSTTNIKSLPVMVSKIAKLSLNLILVSFAAAGAVNQVNAASPMLLYVAPTGEDSSPGTKAVPFKSLAGAQGVARQHLAAMAANREPRASIKIEIQPGTYELTSSFQLTDADSGVVDSPTVYEAVIPGTVVLSGGNSLSQVNNSSTQATFSQPAATVDWSAAQQLYVNDHRAILAREPNADTSWFVTRGGSHPIASHGKTDTSTFGASSEALKFLSALSPQDRTRAVIDVYQSWTTGRHRLTEGPPTGEVGIAPPAKWPFLLSGTSQRWFVENVKSALDAPGEWYGDVSGITYLKQANDSGTVTAVLPMLDVLVAIKGQASSQHWAQFLELRGLTFEYSRLLTPATGLLDGQAASEIGAALEVDAARNVTIADCKFVHLGGYGIWMRGNVRDSALSDNVLTDLGAGGIRVGLTMQASNDPTATGNIQVIGNMISHTGLIMPGAVGIWVGQSFGNTITKNRISDTTYSGISVGWTWGYAPATAGQNAITDNLLYNIGRGEMSDLGGIYALGVQPGTVISGNLIREVRGYPGYGPGGGAGAWGIYADEGFSQAVIENNVVVGTDSGAFHLHYGRNDTLRNNLFAGGKDAELRITKSDPLTRLVAQGNLFIVKSTQPFDVHAGPADVLFARNAVSSTASGAADLSNCGEGCVRSTAKVITTTNPKGVTLTGASPDIAAIVNRTVANAGPLRAASRNNSEPQVLMSAARSIKLAAPADLDLDIEGTPMGNLPAALEYRPGADPAAIQLVERASAQANSKCIQMTDSSANTNKWEPLIFARFDFSSGTAEITFQLKVDSATEFIHEWRDASSHYKAGPSFTISARGVESHGELILPVALNAWNTFHVTAKLGKGAGTWSLTIQDAAGGIKAVSDQPNISSEFHELKWVGFISNANVSSTACLGSLKVRNHT